jgi:hypothetical protein
MPRATRIQEVPSHQGKQCRKCLQFKAWFDFYNNTAASDGKQAWCRICFRVYNRTRGSRRSSTAAISRRTSQDSEAALTQPIYTPVDIDPSWSTAFISGATTLGGVCDAGPLHGAQQSVPVYGVEGRSHSAGHKCDRCCRWKVHSAFSSEDPDLCEICIRVVQEKYDPLLILSPVESAVDFAVASQETIRPTTIGRIVRQLKLAKYETAMQIIQGLDPSTDLALDIAELIDDPDQRDLLVQQSMKIQL